MALQRKFEAFATAFHNKGAASDNCWGFVDGTVRPICKTIHDQRAVYNGHKRVHALKFQSVVTANSMIANRLVLLRVEDMTADAN